MRAILITALLASVALAGCTADDTVRIAFVAKDTALAPTEDLDQLTAYLEEATGLNVRVDYFTSSTAALAAIKAGQADIASVDGAAGWLAWQQLGLEAFASETRSDGRTHYMASAWVRTDSDIQTVSDLPGRNSCHTGATKSAGMFMPMGYMTQEGLIDWSGYPDDISQVQEGAKALFDHAQIGGGIYAGYEGALRCLSDGTGDVAFVRDTTPADYCSEDAKEWCLDLADYRELQQFGAVPEHPFMVGSHVAADTLDAISNALFDLDDNDDGRAILDAVFGTDAIVPVETEAHLGQYGGLLNLLPGASGYANSK
ncbi:MAG: phosphate/phosphite/phosphonate ABC transporter substrate-binding protein [Thermoplasmatota archaeon]